MDQVQKSPMTGRHLISIKNILDVIYAIIFNTFIFFYDCAEWDEKTNPDKICPSFEVFLPMAQKNSTPPGIHVETW